MCGRFLQTSDPIHYAELLGACYPPPDQPEETEHLAPSWNVAPTSLVYVCRQVREERLLEPMRWGFQPHWAKPKGPGSINARLETVTEKPFFRNAFAHKRCLIPSEGFYEWTKVGNRKQPFWIRRADGFPLIMAGLWSARKLPGDDQPGNCLGMIQIGS